MFPGANTGFVLAMLQQPLSHTQGGRDPCLAVPGPRANSHPVGWTWEPLGSPFHRQHLHLCTIPLPQLDQVAQSPIKPDHKCFQGQGIHHISRQSVPVFCNPHGKKLPPYIQPKSTHPPVLPPAAPSQHNRTAGDTVPCQWEEKWSSALSHHVTLQSRTQILGGWPAPAQLCAPGKLLFWGATANPKLQAPPALVRH